MPWIDLLPYDVDEIEILRRAVASVLASVPEWDADPLSLEMALLEAMAVEVSEGVYATHRLTRSVFRGVLRLLGAEISDGAAPVGSVTFTAFDTAGHTVPSGTLLRYRSSDAVPVEVLLQTVTTATINVGSASATVDVVGTSNTGAANGAAAGTAVEMIDAKGWVASVTLAETLADGADPETEDDYLDRGAATLARLADTLVLPSHYEQFALEQTGIVRALALNATTVVTPTPLALDAVLGHVTVLVAGAGGAAPSGPAMAAIESAAQSLGRADVFVHVAPIGIVDVNVAAHVRPLPGYTWEFVEASCAAALAAYLDPASWPFGHTVEPNELIEVLGRDTVGVDTVISIDAPATAVPVPATSLVRLGTTSIVRAP